jgi:hypothetical protein
MSETAQAIKARVYPYREKVGMGNIIWAERNLGSAYYRVSRYAMRNGRFPADHPVASGEARSNDRAEMGKSTGIEAFRARGYWASCFPEGDGITWKPERGQDDAQCLIDIRDCFPNLDASWATPESEF